MMQGEEREIFLIIWRVEIIRTKVNVEVEERRRELNIK